MVDYNCTSSIDSCVLREVIIKESIQKLIDGGILNGPHNIGKGTLDDICDCTSDTCIYREIANKKYTRRQLEQMRCIYDYSIILDTDMDSAAMKWVSNGYARAFSEAYSNKKYCNVLITHDDLLRDTTNIIDGSIYKP